MINLMRTVFKKIPEKLLSPLVKKSIFNNHVIIPSATPASYTWPIDLDYDLGEALGISEECFHVINDHPHLRFQIDSINAMELKIYRPAFEKYRRDYAKHVVPHTLDPLTTNHVSEVLGIQQLTTLRLQSQFIYLSIPTASSIQFNIPFAARCYFDEFIRHSCEFVAQEKSLELQHKKG